MAELRPCPNPGCRNTMIHMGRASLPYDDGETETAVLKHQAMCCADDGCGVQGPLRDTETEASAAWNALPREERWVPVSEATPELYRNVEAWSTNEGIVCWGAFRGAKDSWWWDGQRLHGVTHWRPITPPRGPEVTDD